MIGGGAAAAPVGAQEDQAVAGGGGVHPHPARRRLGPRGIKPLAAQHRLAFQPTDLVAGYRGRGLVGVQHLLSAQAEAAQVGLAAATGVRPHEHHLIGDTPLKTVPFAPWLTSWIAA
ncbi:hypothetical protein [Streptomyces iranensis]|uniref:Uncharacterized protein n=1 Tax=Streptomyces iranensis TaxID=576784 RepID=A0A061A3Y8_9ACTN|nr:hypothetical protein [Streptomyces iranensis]MBP2064941.1 hypothetical protein [Streptomyces iranensis]CDR10114.1 predicted protein [Streptomyces iranensis]